MVNIIDKNVCTGCKACGDICPKNAISYRVDDEGFWYPDIDEVKCIHCNCCIQTCPIFKEFEFAKSQPKVYAAWSENLDVRLNSTSGGVYFELANQALLRNGYIIGCIYMDEYKSAVHIVSNDHAGLQKIMGSKYFQSDTAGIYVQTKQLLESGKLVLFCGTPCQNAALSLFLKKEYNNLYQVDFVCRGINSPKAFRKYMEELERRYKSKLKLVHLKNKSKGWQNLGTFIQFNNGKTYYRNRYTDPWVNGYIVGNLFMRPSCAQCKFKKLPRISDVTLGDFWGLPVKKEDSFNGVSVVLINSEKGHLLLNWAEENLFIENHTLEEATSGNPCILNPASMGERRTEFFKRIDNEDFSKVVWDLLNLNSPWRQIQYGILKFKKWLSSLYHRIVGE